MSDDLTKDLQIAIKLLLGKKMKEALLSGNTQEATRLAAELQKAEDLAAAKPSQQTSRAEAPQKKLRPPVKKKGANGEWIN